MNSLLLMGAVICVLKILQVGLTQDLKDFGASIQNWGFVQVREDANIFYWLHYTKNVSKSYYDKPLIMFLEGGPGMSSTGIGNFGQIGPLNPDLSERKYSWVNYVNVLFVDCPVGAGFSYSKNFRSLSRSTRQITKDMMVFVEKFFLEYESFLKSPFYIFGQGYGTKITVQMAKKLHEAISKGNLKVNFKGIALGSPWISPNDSVANWGNFLHNAGLIDKLASNRLQLEVEQIKQYLEYDVFDEAKNLLLNLEWNILLETSYVDFYNIWNRITWDNRSSTYATDRSLFPLMNGPVRNYLMIKEDVRFGQERHKVFKYLSSELMESSTEEVEYLLKKTNLKVVIYNGVSNLIVNSKGTDAWVNRLTRSNRRVKRRTPVYINNIIEMYSKTKGNLDQYWVLRAGRMVPADNPVAAVEILRRTTNYDKL